MCKWYYYGGPTQAKQSGLQTVKPAVSCQVGSPDEVFEPCGPLRVWSQRKHTPRAASSARWMCLIMLITLSPYSSLSSGHWASPATRWLCSPSIGRFVWVVWFIRDLLWVVLRVSVLFSGFSLSIQRAKFHPTVLALSIFNLIIYF